MTEPTEPGDGQFRRELGLFDATMMVVGTMIGSGIFIVSAAIAAGVGSSGWLLMVWIITGAMTVLGALAYAELAGMMPKAGGQYVYLREAFSPLWGFLYGWTLFLVIQTGSIAAVAVAFTKFLGVFVPLLGTEVIKNERGESPALTFVYVDKLDTRITLPLPWAAKPLVIFERNKEKPFYISAGQILAAAIVLGLTFLNCNGVREGKLVQNGFTIAKTMGLVLVIVVGFTWAYSPSAVSANLAQPWSGYTATKDFAETAQLAPAAPHWIVLAMVIGGALVGSLFSADAWNNVTFAAGEVKRPERTVPLALGLGTGLVILIYLLANLAYLAALPAVSEPGSGATSIATARDERVATAVVEQSFPTWGAMVMAALVMISTFGCINGMILLGARLYYAMARDGLFFRAVGGLNQRGVPAVALVLQGIWSVLLIFSGTYNDLLDYVIFAALLFYALTVLGLFRLRRLMPDAPRPVKAPGYPVLPALYVALCTIVMLDLLLVKPQMTWPGLILVAAGIPVYFLWRLFGRPMAAANVG